MEQRNNQGRGGMLLSSVPSVGAAPPFLHITTSAIVLVLVMEGAKIDRHRDLPSLLETMETYLILIISLAMHTIHCIIF